MTPAIDPNAPAAAAAAAAPAVDPAALQTQIDELKEQVAESNRTAEFWAGKARAAAPAAAAAAEEEPDVLEAITTGGAKGFDALAEKRGFIKREEVAGMIEQRAAALTTEQELMERYPDLKNKGSDFFKATAVTYGALVKAGTPPNVAMGMAADKTQLEGLQSGKIKATGAQTKEEKEAARLLHVAAQGGEGSGRRPAAGSPEDDELTPEQKHIADAMGVSHEAYSKRAKAGVSIKGR